MNRIRALLLRNFCSATIVLFAASLMTPLFAQKLNSGGITSSEIEYLNRPVIEDWSSRRVVFSNPGTLGDAQRNGKEEQWRRIVNDPRYRMQWIERYGASAGLMATGHEDIRSVHGDNLVSIVRGRPIQGGRREIRQEESMQGMWSQGIGQGGASTPVDVYPAKFAFSPISAPSCTGDYVVFPVATPGASNQANIVGFNNLNSSCPTTTIPFPNVLFAYEVGTGTVKTSPVLSEDGTKVAFIESITGNGTSTGSKFHVVTLGTTSTGNGTRFSNPVTPCTVNGATACSTNNAVDNNVVLNGGVSVTHSSPFVDYVNDAAYVGDDSGKLHKFTSVFGGTPAEVTTGGWPVTVASGVMLTPPTYDTGTSQNIFVGGSNGVLYCITSAGAACATPSITIGNGPIQDAPIVDSTQQRVFSEANCTSASVCGSTNNAILSQATTSLGSQVNATMGVAGIDLYDGAFDNIYLSSTTGTGYMYFCGASTTAAYSTLWRVAIANGAMSGANDGKSYALETSANGNGQGTNNDCSPLTEFYNSSAGADYLFTSLTGQGNSDCSFSHCIVSFTLPTSTGTFPSAPTATYTSGIGPSGTSALIIDNSSGMTGASQIYFGNIQAGTAMQLSQAALK